MRKPANVMYCSGENSAADTLKLRFRLLDGDESKFYVVEGLIETARGRRASLSIAAI
jgi:hypothetical protein